MLDLDTVRSDIEQWIVNFVEIPNVDLGGWPPCPYARKARLDRDFDVRVGQDPYFDLKNLARWGLGGKSVVIYAYDPAKWPLSHFSRSLNDANNNFLLHRDIIALEDHPKDPEIVNGVCMNQGTYALALCQSLSDLNNKAKIVAKRGFYDTWPEEYLEVLFKHREDPRT